MCVVGGHSNGSAQPMVRNGITHAGQVSPCRPPARSTQLHTAMLPPAPGPSGPARHAPSPCCQADSLRKAVPPTQARCPIGMPTPGCKAMAADRPTQNPAGEAEAGPDWLPQGGVRRSHFPPRKQQQGFPRQPPERGGRARIQTAHTQGFQRDKMTFPVKTTMTTGFSEDFRAALSGPKEERRLHGGFGVSP